MRFLHFLRSFDVGADGSLNTKRELRFRALLTREDTELEAAAHASMCWSKKPQPLEFAFRVEDDTSTAELVRA